MSKALETTLWKRFFLFFNPFRFILTFVMFSSCVRQNEHEYVVMGDKNQKDVWVYLCGLTNDFDSKQEINNRRILDQIGLSEKIKFIAMKPENRCIEYNNKLCWPHDSKKEVATTYKQILEEIKKKKIVGYIGFSNGGFFLNKLAQTKEINVPIISIGSAGFINEAPYANNLYLIIGKQDVSHYDLSIKYFDQAKQFPHFKVYLIEHEGGHEIPAATLMNLLRDLSVKQ